MYRALPRFSNKALGIAGHLLQQAVGTAAGTAVAAVGCHGFRIGTLAFQLQELFADAHIDGIPGKDLVLTVAPGGIEIFLNTAFPESIIPLGIVEIFVPAVQSCTAAHGGFNNGSQTPVSSGKNCLQAA